MTRRHPMPWPAWVLALDVTGSVLIALGIIGLVGGVVPETMDAGLVRAFSIAAIVVGALLTLPFIVTIVRQAAGGKGKR